MRILIIADVHGNWEALRAVVNEPHDHLIFLGDAVDFGPEPRLCVDYLRSHATWGVRGNHDHGIAFDTGCRCYGAWKAWDDATRVHTLRTLSSEDRQYLRSLPMTHRLTVGQVSFALVHAAPTDPLYRYLPADAPDDVVADELRVAGADVLLVGHTHIPMIRRIGERLVVNPGSVGMPRDGGSGACFAVWEDGRVELRRASYDVEATVRRLQDQQLPQDVYDGIAALLQAP
ncbi:MAG: metallophosphoesterase family protein [Armatimonadetes bacterium]|nr:metallophosphoesterase family protein [Armatimonadota bacterium]